MPDFHSDNASWLERELARQLVPVAAPESLWDRINKPQRRRHRRISLDWAFWPVAVSMVVLAFAGILRTLGAHHDSETLTEQELAVLGGASKEGLDFRSESFEDTRAWVKAKANIDIDLPAGQPVADHGTVRLLGARLIQFRGLPVAAIDYSAGGDVATLFVSGKHAGLSGNAEASKHLFSRMKSAGDTRLVSWNMRNQTYAIAFTGAENPHGACLLCHVNTPSLLFAP
jgi:hypothetical protein